MSKSAYIKEHAAKGSGDQRGAAVLTYPNMSGN